MPPGKVYLVGAGPGHPELLTVKAAKLLGACDVIVYDRLIQEDVLALANPAAERIYMGKPVGRHESRQDEIHCLLAERAREGKTVVRLKGGDPFLFGRGAEEAEFLAREGIPFEVVPGVSSALAAPLSAGIAVTHRDAASAVAIVTGHEAGRGESRLNWQSLAGIDTLVFLMAVHTADRIASSLIAHGRSPDTPAAMIQMAFWRGEKVIVGTLATIAEEVERAGITPPATLVIGEAVRLREKLNCAHRDLSRRSDAGSHFVPSPLPDQLFRMAAAGMGSQVLRFALAACLFDQLENWQTAPQLARTLGLNRHGLGEVLECLVSLGLLECGPDGYRNLELASRYLVGGSPQTLRPALLYQAAHTASLSAVGRYVLNGRQGGPFPDLPQLRAEACECLARFAAQFVVDKLDMAGCGRALLIGWGGESYRKSIGRRWPAVRLDIRNPFESGDGADMHCIERPGDGPFGRVILSGLLGCCDRGQFRPALERAASLLDARGILILHDSFIGAEGPARPEFLLSALGRHVVRGGCRNWSLARLGEELDSLGLRMLSSEVIPAGTQLVLAARA